MLSCAASPPQCSPARNVLRDRAVFCVRANRCALAMRGIELVKRRVSSGMVTADKINHCLGIRRGGSLGLFTHSSLIGAVMGAGFFVTAIAISASAQTREQIAEIAARQAQKNGDLAISQRDALEAQLEDATLATIQRDSLQNQPKTEEAGTNQSQQHVVNAADRSQPQQGSQSATSEALPAPVSPKPWADNEQATAWQNQVHRSPSESARPQKIHRTRETKTRNSATSTRATPFLSQIWNQWNQLWQRPKANP
jgi:hypothetical protein